MTIEKQILAEISQERDRQDAIYGGLPKDGAQSLYLGILTSELGEVASAMLKGNMENYREELIQVAAVCVRAIEDLERGTSEYSLEDVCPRSPRGCDKMPQPQV